MILKMSITFKPAYFIANTSSLTTFDVENLPKEQAGFKSSDNSFVDLAYWSRV